MLFAMALEALCDEKHRSLSDKCSVFTYLLRLLGTKCCASVPTPYRGTARDGTQTNAAGTSRSHKPALPTRYPGYTVQLDYTEIPEKCN
jgi:hypothetical protein